MCAGLYKGGGFWRVLCCVDLVVKLYLETLRFRWWNLRSSDAGGDPQHISQFIQMMARLGFWTVVEKKHTGRAAFYMGCITMLAALIHSDLYESLQREPCFPHKKRSRQLYLYHW